MATHRAGRCQQRNVSTLCLVLTPLSAIANSRETTRFHNKHTMATKQTGTPNGGRNRSAQSGGQMSLNGLGTTHLPDGVEPPNGGAARTLWAITLDEWDHYLSGGVGFDELQARAERRITMHTGHVGENHPDAEVDQ